MLAVCLILNLLFPSEAIKTEKTKINRLLQQQDVIQSITIGRSHAYSIDYDYYSLKGMNFALGGRDIASIRYFLEYAVPLLPNLKEVLICISYSSLYFDNYALSKGNLNDARIALYASIPSFAPINRKDINNLLFGKFIFFIRGDHGFNEFRQFLEKKKGGGGGYQKI